MITVENCVPSLSVEEAVLFPFDSYSIPFTAGLHMQLIGGKIPGRANPVVVPVGEPGAPDDQVVRFYGTVIPIDGELRMWYLAKSTLDDRDRDGPQLRVCYATSQDGIHWNKPDLGVAEFQGSRKNNVVNLRGGHCDFVALPIIHDPEDPDPNRRFKVVFESHVYGNQFSAACSPDGLNWTESPNNPVGQTLEQTGLIKFNGCYYVNGQGGWHYVGNPWGARLMSTFASYDFETWTRASCLSFRRDPIPPRQPNTEWGVGEEVHLGAGLWNRGNVILGVYDMWHGHPSISRGMCSMDLGLVISHDALHFHEPIPDFKFMAAFEEVKADAHTPPQVSHGQGMYNIGDKTMLWYENWGHTPVEVRLATWERDRLGYFQAMGPGGAHFVTCPMRLSGPTRLWANVAGLGENSELQVEVLDERFNPIDGFAGDNAAVLTDLEQAAASAPAELVPGQAAEESAGETPGLRVPVTWKHSPTLPAGNGPIRLRVNFAGVRPEDIRLYAMYVTSAGP